MSSSEAQLIPPLTPARQTETTRMTSPLEGRSDALGNTTLTSAPAAAGATVADPRARPAEPLARAALRPLPGPWTTPAPIGGAPASTPRAWLAAKRAFDVAFSLTMLLLTLPLMALIALAIRFESRGPVFYRTRRVGFHGQALMMLKFRKMHQHAAGAPLTALDDDRFTRVGAFLTASRLDELPQLWDVLRGRMSVIGPRPEDPRFVSLHPDEYQSILTVRPGMLGLSQLAYQAEKRILRADQPIEDYVTRIMPQKLILDRLYAQRTSARLDFDIICWAIMALFLRRPVAVDRHTGTMNVRRRSRASRPAAPAESAD
jgi:lipopolysaccharide/colanic/teichoic acid biosynthesis glycosyltransferase